MANREQTSPAAARAEPELGFSSDNIAAASPEVIDALIACNAGQARPYGADELTARGCALPSAAWVRGTAGGARCRAVTVSARGREQPGDAADQATADQQRDDGADPVHK